MWPFKPSKAKLDVLADLLRSEDADKRSGAAADLRKIGNNDAMRVLFDGLADNREDTRKAAYEVLIAEDIPTLEGVGPAAEELLCTVLKYRSGALAKPTCEALARIGGARAAEALCEYLVEADSDKLYKIMCDFARISYVPGQVPETIVKIRHKTESPGRLAAVKALGCCGDSEAIPALKATLDDDDPVVSKAAADMLVQPRFAQVPHPQSTAASSQTKPGDSAVSKVDTPVGYGLSITKPVLVPGGAAKGAANEKKYLSRLRCPNGKLVKFSRRGSENPMMAAMSEGDTQSKEAIMAEISEALQKYGPSGMPAKYSSVDLYDVKCTCGDHEVTVYINMYEAGPDEPIGLPGWTLAD